LASIAIIGPGAIGATVAAYLARAGHAVTLCARTPLDGIVIDGPDGLVEARPAVVTDPAAATPVDWALVCTKAYDVAGAAAWLPALTGPATRVAVLQNGVEHRERFAGVVAPDRLTPVIVDIPAERTAPGRVLQHRHGTLTVPDDAGGRAFVALFAGTPLAAQASPDWLTAAWRKLCVNAPGLALTLIDRPFGASRHPGAAAALRMLADECAAVGRAAGANLPPDMADQIVAYYQAQAPTLRNSLHNDLSAGRPLELDARDGVVVRLGERYGVPTPGHRLLIGLTQALAGTL
jgi:2-dehydropantoate 2-reductase